jgi:FAD/FMN-containing dehydrogenase
LSPSYNGPVCYIGFLVYLSEDYNGNDDRLQMLRDIEAILAEFDAVPHYGKFFTSSLYPLAKTLPKWDQFKSLRQQYDPNGVFLNKFVRNLLDIPTERRGAKRRPFGIENEVSFKARL